MTTAAHAAPQARRKKGMADSVAVFEAAEGRRLRKPVLVNDIKIASVVTVIPFEELSELFIDESYQRARVGAEVNDLINVLLSGGQVPDPIDVAEREDGTRYIVDGQQRFWAHLEAKKPLKAHIHKVPGTRGRVSDAEMKLYVALNSHRGLNPKNVLKAWPGPVGDYIRRLNDSEDSPLRKMINLAQDSDKPIDGGSLARAITLVITGGTPHGGDTATYTLPRADAALRITGAKAWADGYIQLLCAVFGPSTGKGGQRVRVLPMMALARVAHRKFMAAGRVAMPKSTSRMRQVNWNNAVPSHAQKYLGMLEDKIERMWH